MPYVILSRYSTLFRQDVRMGGAYSFPTPLPAINNHQDLDQTAAISNLTATVSRMLVTNVSGVLQFRGRFNALQAGIFPEYANLVEVGGQVRLIDMVGVTDTGPEAFPTLTKIGQSGFSAHSNADLQVVGLKVLAKAQPFAAIACVLDLLDSVGWRHTAPIPDDLVHPALP